MKNVNLISFAIFAGAIALNLGSPVRSYGQGSGSAGQNAVFNSTTACRAGSSAFIDGFILSQNNSGIDICDTIYKILKGTIYNYPAAGAVIDARGISGNALTCTQGSPWSENGNYVNKPSTILLPAGTIQISTTTTWVLPGGTHLIGEGTTGANDINGSAVPTTIQNSGSITSGAMIQFGDSTHCPSTGRKHLVIPNRFSGEESAVPSIFDKQIPRRCSSE